MKQVAPPWQLPKALLPYRMYRCLLQGVKEVYLIHRNKHREVTKLKRQRNMAQMKEENKTPEKELNKIEIANLSDAELKTLVIRMLRELAEYSNNKGRNEGYTK